MNEREVPLSPTRSQPAEWPAQPPTAGFDVAGATDRGRKRAKNEDAFAVAPLPDRDGLLLVVADGLGGAPGGEVASRIAVDAVLAELTRRPLPADRTLRPSLRHAVESAGEALVEAVRQQPELAGFGTTLTAAVIAWPELWVAHVGDTRAYLWRAGRLERLTRDHTMAERLREQGLVSAGQKLPSWESVLWNSLGPAGEEAQVEERHVRLQPDDRLLLCSDGLTRHLLDDELARRLSQRTPARQLCAELVDAANHAGGEDNVTAVVARAGVAVTAPRAMATS